MACRRSLMLLLLFAAATSSLLAAVPASATEADGAAKTAESDDAEREGETEEEKLFLPTVQAIFPKVRGGSTPTFHAGSRVDALIAFRNNDQRQNSTVLLVSASVAPAHTPNQILQNFSAIRHARIVQYRESASFHYTFTPHALLEPNDYHLIVGVYYKNGETEQPQFVAAFNETVAIEASLDTDPSTILTYLTLLAITCAVVYVLASKYGILSLLRGKNESSSERRRVEVGTKGDGYDPDYVSEEHLRYKEAVLMRRSSQSPKKKK
ncbi:hypothetical protein, conserved [Trypanosoma brucei gambiense DAL972]|uniref:Uncharacterized protein n=1 Tax=Trypanosoma brucei gambiense (strain MHOM/CI/86/DAL972) TaxID=679716 RepID=C9ZSE4_TRYB9|nr:hypothetical protein, conserved [Trypanosoma brucei gambiense DAL972]CBH12282.1 hypothetical protein, conserved [Trypanosoma brucei gambiense DAL972]|eukprot:XP_011774563.1 hypothetical protein, conserved [Trypanosoma brucei gambiense DAL972]